MTEESYTLQKPATLFPLIRHISARVTPMLVATPLTANQVTAASLIFGLGASLAYAQGTFELNIWGALLFFLMYLMDHCDGEVARAKGQSSPGGEMFDSFVDGIVHATFFAGLGYGATQATDEAWWYWAGLAAGAGALINYLLGLYNKLAEERERKNGGLTYDGSPESSERPEGLSQTLIFAFRELARADFWLIVAVLTVLDVVWYLLPFAAVGAQVYWISFLIVRDKKFRV